MNSSVAQKLLELEQQTARSESIAEELALRINELEIAARPMAKSRRVDSSKEELLKELAKLREIIANGELSERQDKDESLENEIEQLRKENDKLKYRIVHLLRNCKNHE